MKERNGYYHDPLEKREDERYAAMDWATRGMYEWLRDQCWIAGSIPADHDHLEQILQGIGPLNFRAIWSKLRRCFKPIVIDGEDRLICPEVERERSRRNMKRAGTDETQKKMSEAGRRGAEKRWKTPSLTPSSTPSNTAGSQDESNQQINRVPHGVANAFLVTSNKEQVNTSSSPTPSSPEKSQDDASQKNQPAVRSVGDSAPADSVRYADSVRQLCAQLPQVALPRVPVDLSDVVVELQKRRISLEIVEAAIWVTIANWLKAWQDSAPPRPIRSMRYFLGQIDAFAQEYSAASDRGMKTPLAMYVQHERSRILRFVEQKTVAVHGPP